MNWNIKKNLSLLAETSPFGGLKASVAILRTSGISQSALDLAASSQEKIPDAVRLEFKARITSQDFGESAGKYFDSGIHLTRAAKIAIELGLQDSTISSQKNILDIGTGFGYFPMVCKEYDHRVWAIDKGGKPAYREAREKLGVDVIEWTVTSSDPLPLSLCDTQFDLVTAIQPVFFLYDDCGEYQKPWGVEQWVKFFLNLEKNLSREGIFFLGGNFLSENARVSHQKSEKFFRSVGGERLLDGWLFQKSVISGLNV
jgi:cyclopropane fatty-acyl-phospholipid synthase-like methyltransferase